MSDDLDFEMEVVQDGELDEMDADGANRVKRPRSTREEDREVVDSKERGIERTEPENKSENRESSSERWTTLGAPPEDWETRKVGSLTEMRNGEATDHVDEEEAEYTVYGSNGPIGSYREPNFDGGLVVGRVGAVGEVEWVPEAAWVSDNAIQLSVKEAVNDLYLYYALDDYKMAALATTTAQPLLNQSTVSRVSIPLPPLPEQRKIASVLYAVDQAIQKTEAIIEQTKRVKRGLMQRLLREGIGNHRLTDTGTDLGQLPEHWKSVPLSDAIAPGEYTFTDGARQTLRADEIHEEGEARVILLQEVGVGSFNDENPKFATQEKYKEIEHRAIYPGEVVIAKMADPIARACTIPDTYDKYLLGCADVVRLEADDDYDSRFLMYCMNSHDVWKQAAAHLRAAGRNRINLENIAELYIPKPPLEEQKEVANRLTTVDAQLDRDRVVAERLERLKKGLMQDLLTGEVRTMCKAIEVLGEVKAHG